MLLTKQKVLFKCNSVNLYLARVHTEVNLLLRFTILIQRCVFKVPPEAEIL